MDAWAKVLSPGISLDERRPHIEDFDTLETIIDQAATTAEALGVTITPIRATVTGDIAIVTFDAGLGASALSPKIASTTDLAMPLPDQGRPFDVSDGTGRTRFDPMAGTKHRRTLRRRLRSLWRWWKGKPPEPTVAPGGVRARMESETFGRQSGMG
ncbi:MAG: hypothetical protein AAF547_00525 [Actinomycetota bacterium]